MPVEKGGGINISESCSVYVGQMYLAIEVTRNEK